MVLKEWVGVSQTELLGIVIADRDPKTLRWEIVWGVRGTNVSVGLEHRDQDETWDKLRVKGLAGVRVHGTL